jgi:phosphotransferase system HPr (HPr) family protein
MKRTRVKVKQSQGLHARAACEFIRLVRRFRSEIHFRKGSLLVDGKSIVGLLMLGATLNTPLDVEVDGDDEDETVQVVESFFAPDDGGDGSGDSGAPMPGQGA